MHQDEADYENASKCVIMHQYPKCSKSENASKCTQRENEAAGPCAICSTVEHRSAAAGAASAWSYKEQVDTEKPSFRLADTLDGGAANTRLATEITNLQDCERAERHCIFVPATVALSLSRPVYCCCTLLITGSGVLSGSTLLHTNETTVAQSTDSGMRWCSRSFANGAP